MYNWKESKQVCYENNYSLRVLCPSERCNVEKNIFSKRYLTFIDAMYEQLFCSQFV